MSGERRGDWMQTYSGRAFWPLDPRPEEVSIIDIAHHLSMKCRYAGASRCFYSVAEHSVHICRALRLAGAAVEVQLWGLMHDAAEAYLPDVTRPIKPDLQGFAAIEARVMRAICIAFGIEGAQPDIVTRYDEAILADEREQIMGPPPRPWRQTAPPLGINIRGWEPPRAALEFFGEFADLQRARAVP